MNPSRVFVNNGVGNYNFTGDGAIGGVNGATFTKLGSGTATLGNANRNTFAGGVSLFEGTLALDLSAIYGHANLIDSGARVIMSGGALVVIGNATGSSSQAFANVDFESGASTVAVNTNGGTGTTLNLGFVIRSPGATVDFTPPTGGSKIVLSTSATYVAPSGYLLGYGTFGGSDWAVAGTDSSIIANTTYANDTWSTTGHTNVTTSVSVPAGAQGKTLRFNSPVSTTLTLSGSASLWNGGILITANVGPHNNTITGGNLASLNYKDLIVIQNNSQGTLTISSTIIDDPDTTAVNGLTISGCGVVALTAANTYPKITTINNAILAITQVANGGSPSGIGNSSNAAVNLVLNQGTLRYTGGTGSTDRLLTLGPGGGSLDASGTGAVTFSNTGAVAYFQDTPRRVHPHRHEHRR